MNTEIEDGNDKVPAKRHENGGGWVALSAKVDISVYVDGNARVFGNVNTGEIAN